MEANTDLRVHEEKGSEHFSDLIYFPKSIFKTKLTVFESVVFYLKEEKNISLHNIAELLKRDERNIWTIYSRAKKKAEKWMR